MPPIRPDAHRLELDWIDPEQLFVTAFAHEPHAFWLDAGHRTTSGRSLLGAGTPASAPLRASLSRDAAAHAPRSLAGGWVGWFDFDEPEARGPASTGMQVDAHIVFDHDAQRLFAVAADADALERLRAAHRRAAVAPPAPHPPAATVSTARSHDTPDTYRSRIAACRDAIGRGDAYQLCLTTRFTVPGVHAPLDAFRRLRRTNPSHHAALIRCGDRALVSASPERFLEVTGARIRTHPIKGTRPRGATAADDERLADELRTSVKERAENVMIVDLMRNDLHRVCAPASVTVERLLEVERYPGVHQLVSTIGGLANDGVRVGDVLNALFPAGSMTGAPKQAAIELLRTIEARPRGAYAGCFGWIGATGDADLAMTIRSIVIEAGAAYVGAGGGITWRSEPDAEVAEVALKARGPLAALGARLPADWQP